MRWKAFAVPGVVAATVLMTALDLYVPEQVESGFFFIVPLLLSQRARSPRLTWGVAGFVVCWTVVVSAYNLLTQSGPLPVYGLMNDLLGMIAVLIIAFFIVGRIRAEGDLNSIIDFVDGRMKAPEDNHYLRTHRPSGE